MCAIARTRNGTLTRTRAAALHLFKPWLALAEIVPSKHILAQALLEKVAAVWKDLQRADCGAPRRHRYRNANAVSHRSACVCMRRH